MRRILVLAPLILAPLMLAAGTAIASAAPTRIRGTIETMAPDHVVIASRDGGDVTLALAGTKFAQVVPSSLGSIAKGDFIGTATKGPPNAMVALEVVIFPESMRGTGEGNYPWDSIPDTTLAHPVAKTSSTMTNGNVDAAQPMSATAKSNSSMTNGTVSAGENASAGRSITVSYHGGSVHVLVPPTAPVVAFQPGNQALLHTGAKVFVVATGTPDHLTARFIAVGHGITPPM